MEIDFTLPVAVEITVPLVNGEIDYNDEGVKLLLPLSSDELKNALVGKPITREYCWHESLIGKKGCFGSAL